jgi:hypothetical protein
VPFGVAAAGITAAAGIGTAMMQSSAVKSGQSAANAAQLQAQQQAREDVAPWTSTGGQALGQTANLLGLNGQPAADAAMTTFQQSPGYQWQLGQGLRAIDAGNAAAGILRSGATEKAEMTYGEGLANQDFTNYYNRLYQLSGQGLTGATATGNQAVTTGQGIAGTDASAAAAQSSIYGNLGKGISTTANTLLSNPGFQSWVSPAPVTDPINS